MIKKILYKFGSLDKIRRVLEKNYLPFFPSRFANYVLIPYFLENKDGEFKEILLLDIIQQVFDDKVFNKNKITPLLINNLINSLVVARDIDNNFNKIYQTNTIFGINDTMLKENKSKFIQEGMIKESEFLSNTDKWNIFKLNMRHVEKYNVSVEKIRNRTIDFLLDLEKSKKNETIYVEEGSKLFVSFLKEYSKLIKEKRNAFENFLFQDVEEKKTYLSEFNKEDVINSVFVFSQVKNLNLVKDKLEKCREEIDEVLYKELSIKANQNFNFVILSEFFLDYINSGGIINSIDNIINNEISIDIVKKQFEITNRVEKIYNNENDHRRSYQERMEFFIEEVSNLCLSDRDLSLKYIDQIKEKLDKQVEIIKDKINKGYIHKDLFYKVFIDGIDKDLKPKLRELGLLKEMNMNVDISKQARKKAKI